MSAGYALLNALAVAATMVALLTVATFALDATWHGAVAPGLADTTAPELRP